MVLSNVSGIFAESLSNQTNENLTNLTDAQSLTENLTGDSNTTLEDTQNTTTSNASENSSLNETSDGSAGLDVKNVNSSSENSTEENNSSNLSNVELTATNGNNSSESSISNTSNNSSVAAGSSTSTKSVKSITLTITSIKDAAKRVVAYVAAHKVLPNYVTISGTQIQMPEFLNLLVNALLKIKSGKTTSVTSYNYTGPSTSVKGVTSAKLYSSDYLKIASYVASFMKSNSRAPNYVSSSKGKIGYSSLIYMYSNILSFTSTKGRLPNYVTVKYVAAASTSTSTNSSSTVPAALAQYLKATTNCQSTNAQIVALSKSIISSAGATTTYAKAVAIFNWVRDNIGYSFYYNTKYGAVGTLKAKTGNCVDTTHLLIALERAAGIPARYVHGYCKFSSGSWYGHVWAEIYVGGKWYSADAISYRNSFGVIKNWNTATATIYGRYASLSL
jgi:transglutaminase-like putative cysteine protease